MRLLLLIDWQIIMKLFIVSIVLLFPFCVVSANNNVPTDSELRVVVSDDVMAAFTELELKEQARGKSDFSSTNHDEYIRVKSKYAVDKSFSQKDFFYDRKRVACFGNDNLLRCFAQVGWRGTSPMSRDRIEDKPFLFVQIEAVFRKHSDGSLKPIRACRYDECRELE